jgi:hypothetical protein
VRVVGRLLILALTASWMVVQSPPASADGRSDAYIDDSGNPTAEASTGGSQSGGSAAPPSDCVWQLINEDDQVSAMYDANGNRIYSPTGRWYQKICDGASVEVNGSFAVPESAPVDPADLAQQARQSVAIPVPPLATSPPADRKLYTRVPTWLWVDADWWRGYSATADAGGVSSTVLARPVRAVWTMGDGGQAVCEGPGTEWRPGMAEEQSTCSYVYKNSSAGQRGDTFEMTVEVEFEVSWTSSIGPGGSLARITRSASQAVQVGEIQAVETQ